MHRIDFHKRRDLPSASSEALRLALRQFASGVTIVTAAHEGVTDGVTVSAFTSISLEPPVIMVAINLESPLPALITEAEHFAVHILSADQAAISDRFAATAEGAWKFEGITSTPLPSGAPALSGPFAGQLAVLDCALDQTLEVGTHMLLFGRVVSVHAQEEPGEPLVYYHRDYRRLGPA